MPTEQNPPDEETYDGSIIQYHRNRLAEMIEEVAELTAKGKLSECKTSKAFEELMHDRYTCEDEPEGQDWSLERGDLAELIYKDNELRHRQDGYFFSLYKKKIREIKAVTV